MRLRKERKKAGLTQGELARMSGVPQSSISKMERGDLLRPTFDTLDKLAKALGRRGRFVQPGDIKPRPQPALIKGFRSERRKGAA
jgi:transcriptional regulator with XRE-family HTH domain